MSKLNWGSLLIGLAIGLILASYLAKKKAKSS